MGEAPQALLFHSELDSAEEWRERLTAEIPGLDFRVWPDVGNADEISFALVWKPPPGMLAGFEKLRCICSLGQGVDHIFTDPDMPPEVPVVRLVDPWMSQAMSEWVLLNILWFHREGPHYDAAQRAGRWSPLPPPQTSERRVGVLGLGALGADAVAKAAALGFPSAGWSRTAKSIPGVECFHGDDQLPPFLARTDILCCLLPLTPATSGIINARSLAALPKGSFVINSGRGGHIVDADLLAALASGHIAGASLDVFHEEPLGADHPYWQNPNVKIWPHISAQTNAGTAVAQVADAVRKVFAGKVPNNLVDRARQY